MKLKNLTLALAVSVSVANAQPWEPNVIWHRDGAEDSCHYGWNVLALKDQNDDGFNDWGVFAYGPLGNPSGDSAYVEFFHGGPNLPQIPYMTFTSHRPTDYIRRAKAVGDVNDDGYEDWFLDRYLPGVTPPNHIEIYFGGPAADTLPDVVIPASGPDWTTGIGDFNGDGFDDIHIYREMSRFAEVYLGSENMDSISDWRTSDLPSAWSAAARASGGDLNHDGYADWCGGDLNTNITYVYLGSANPDTTPSLVWDTLPPVDVLYPLAIVRDMNGDGYDELLYNYGYLIFGAENPQPVIGQTIWLNSSHTTLPEVAYSAGDLNHDGFGDVVMINSLGSFCDGEASIHLGAAWINSSPVYHLCGGNAPFNLRWPTDAAAVGDVDGDSVDDLMIGATNYPLGLGRGMAIILGGDSTLRVLADERPELVEDFSVSAYPNPFNASTRITFSIPKAGAVIISLYNLGGQRVMNVLDGHYSPGEHAVTLNGEGLASGIYFVRVEAEELRAVKKVVVMK